jgi:adenylate cyclase
MARRREASLRRRFEQHLSPSVVARIAANPDVLRLNGEMRQITALFSDIEGFSAISRTARPEELIATLDDYFEGVATIIIRHGGMIDKFVGDAVHAFFNMPLDLPDHVDKAVLCAQEIIRWTQEYQQTSLPERIGLGRTRIGLETGDAVVGDVGLATKLDYTAYGHAVNIASRLEDLNKQFGTAICVGPCAATVSSLPLRSLGLVELRGVGMLEVFTFDDCAQ